VNEFDNSVLYSTLLWCDSILFFVTCYLIYLEVGSLVVVLLGIFCFIILIQGKWLKYYNNLLISSCSVCGKNIGCIKNKNTKDNRPEISSNQRDDRWYHANKILHLGRVTKQKSQKLESKEIIDLLFHFYQRLYKFTLSAILSLFINRCILIIFR
jgi:hypothetical protein